MATWRQTDDSHPGIVSGVRRGVGPGNDGVKLRRHRTIRVPILRLNQSYGGFGLEYAQPLANGGAVMDQYGMWHGVPSVTRRSLPSSSPPPLPAPARTSRACLAPRCAVSRDISSPTGSLGWTGANGGILYSPGMRYQSYGNGYGHGPYGVTDYQYMWKGWVTD